MEPELTKRILATVDDEEIINLEQSLVRIPSFTYEEAELADYLAEYMSAAGIEVEMHEVVDPFDDSRKSKQPVGRIRGNGTGQSLMFNGHMDHQVMAGNWKRDPFGGEIEGDWLYGRGAIDEKGGVTGLVIAGIAIAKAGLQLRGDLLLCPVMGHKSGGVGTKHNLEHDIQADLCINTETTDLGVITTGVGVVRAHITFRGRPVHFNSPQEKKAKAVFPIPQMARLITRLETDIQPILPGGWLAFEPDPELPGFPQIRVDGIESQFAPDNYCRLDVQIRTVPGQNAETIQRDLERLVAEVSKEGPKIEAEFEVPPLGGFDFPPYKIPSNHALPKNLAHWHEFVSGHSAIVGAGPRLGACGDANFLANAGMPTVQYGPGSIAEYDTWPAADERIKIDDLLVSARTMMLAAADICGVQ